MKQQMTATYWQKSRGECKCVQMCTCGERVFEGPAESESKSSPTPFWDTMRAFGHIHKRRVAEELLVGGSEC